MSKHVRAVVPYSKQAKKLKRQADLLARGDWGLVKPVTKALPDKTKYSRCNNKTSLSRLGALPPHGEGRLFNHLGKAVCFLRPLPLAVSYHLSKTSA